jgi:D-xylose transport system substrate-binding protein
MTVYRPVRQEAEAAAQLAYDLAFGVAVGSAVTGGNSADNGATKVPAVLIQPVAVTRRTVVSTVIADGFWTRAQICTADYAAACRAAGLS